MNEQNESGLPSEAASRSSDGLGAVCEHGSMKRKCLVCELTAERDRCKELISTLEIQAVQSSEMDWMMIPSVEWDQAWERFHSSV